MSTAWLVAEIVAGVWLLVALLQLGDVATAFLDSRTARDRDVHGRIARERTNELFWVIPVGAIVALGIGLGIDHVGATVFSTSTGKTGAGVQHDTLLLGTLFLLGLAVLVVGIGAMALAATAATDPISYFALRRSIRDYEGERITPRQLADFRKRLARIDARTRSRMNPNRRLLTAPSILRLATVLVGIAVVVTTWVAQAQGPRVPHPGVPDASLAYLSLLAPVLSALFAALAIRFAIASDAAWRRVYARQRVDILKLLEEFDRSTRKRTPGLRTRVANALKILGEQQD